VETLSPSTDRDMKRDLSITTSAEIPYMRRVIAVFSRGSGNSGFFQGVAK